MITCGRSIESSRSNGQQPAASGHKQSSKANEQTIVFAIYQLLLGWKTCKYYYETDELPNPRPTQPKKNLGKGGIWATFYPQHIIFRRLGLFFCKKLKNVSCEYDWDCFCIGNRPQETRPNQILRKPPITRVHSNQDLVWCVKIGAYMRFCVHRGF